MNLAGPQDSHNRRHYRGNFGEIQDEHDKIDFEEAQVSRMNLFSWPQEIDYINEKYNLNLPESSDYETLSGFIVSHCECIPKLNEQIKVGSFVIQILKVDQTRVETVKLFWQP